MNPFVMVLLIAVIAIFASYAVYEQKANKKVLDHSQRIKDLLILNQEIRFHDVSNSFSILKHYDNKSNFNKIEPAYLMTYEIRGNIDYYSNYITQIKENRSKSAFYGEKVQDLLQKEYEVDYAALGFSERTYFRYERKLFNERIITAVTDCAFGVTMTYSSPKGKVNLSKGDIFTFEELSACFESISRTRLDRETYSRLATVERGEVSDSLRYDILNRDNFTCVICGASSSIGARLHVDHIVPIAKGGKSVPENLRTLCERCNIGKSDKVETTAEQQSDAVDSATAICSLCGGELVLRKGRYGDFYGCSNYPKCKFTKKVEK